MAHEDWMDAEAEKIVQKLLNAKVIGDLTRRPDITALVLAKLDDELPKLLTAEWAAEGVEKPFDPHEEAEDSETF